MLPCLTLSIIRYGSRVKWSNPRNGVAPSPTPQCRSYWKGNLWVTLDYSRQLYFFMWHNISQTQLFSQWHDIFIDRALHKFWLYKCAYSAILFAFYRLQLDAVKELFQWCLSSHVYLCSARDYTVIPSLPICSATDLTSLETPFVVIQ